MRDQKKDKARPAPIGGSREMVLPSQYDTRLLNEIHSWGASEIAGALRRCEERCLYGGAEPPSKEQLNDAYMLRLLAGHVALLPDQAHLRMPVRVITLKSA